MEISFKGPVMPIDPYWQLAFVEILNIILIAKHIMDVNSYLTVSYTHLVPLKMEQGTGSFLLSEKTKLYTNLQGGEAELWENYLKALPVQLKDCLLYTSIPETP